MHQMFRAVRKAWLLPVLLAGSLLGAAQAAESWSEGTHYFAVVPPQRANVPPGKVEVTEVFSYGCPACYQFFPTADKLKAAMTANVVFDYLPASFNPGEDWVVFQQAYYAALALGISERTHDAMFDAIWGKGGELSIMDADGKRLKDPLPSIENVADFYKRTAGVDREKFLATAKSFGVAVKMKHADDLIRVYQADSTPTIIVNGKYRLNVRSAGGLTQTIDLVKYLVAKESGAPAAH